MLNNDNTLQLDYTLTSTPNPIRASMEGSNPNIIGVQVMISDPTLNLIKMSKIIIQIPVGENITRDLSSMSSLPEPQYDQSGPWNITSSGGRITITPKAGGSGKITSAIIFSLENIPVNEAPGSVPITITEFAASSTKISNDNTYVLIKLKQDFPVINFYTTPSVLKNLDQPFTIFWECNELGKEYSYSLSSNNWHPKKCIDTGDCYTWEDGVNGVAPPDILETTTFELDVIQTNSQGHRQIIETLYTSVNLTMPEISGNSHLTHSKTGRIISLKWVALNAARCSVSLDGTIIEDNAPVNTYETGYPILMTTPGEHQVVVTAHAQIGDAQASHVFPNVNTGELKKTIPIWVTPQNVACTTDGKLAFVSCFYGGAVEVIDVRKRKLVSTIPTDTNAAGTAILTTSDDKYAIVANKSTNNITVIDITALKAIKNISTADSPWALAATNDNKRLVVAYSMDTNMSVIDLDTLEVLPYRIPSGESSTALAFTPDTKQLWVVNDAGSNSFVSVIDWASHKRIKTIPVDDYPLDIRITPDGKSALVTTSKNVTIIDVDTQTITHTLETGKPNKTPQYIAISPNGDYALVTHSGMDDKHGPGYLTLINLDEFTIGNTLATRSWYTQGLAITDTDEIALIVEGNGISMY